MDEWSWAFSTFLLRSSGEIQLQSLSKVPPLHLLDTHLAAAVEEIQLLSSTTNMELKKHSWNVFSSSS